MGELPSEAAWVTPAGVDEVGGHRAALASAAAEAFHRTPIFDVFAGVAAARPGSRALVAGGRALSFGELHRAALGFGAVVARATPVGGSVAVVLDDDIDIVIAWLGCLAAGRTAIILNAAYPDAHLAAVLADAVPDAVVGARVAWPVVLTVGDGDGDGFVPTPAGPDAAALVIYSSGSTGRPKGVANSQAQLMVRAFYNLAAGRARAGEQALTTFRYSAMGGSAALLRGLLAGATSHSADPRRVGVQAMLALIRDEGIVTLSLAPSVFRLMAGMQGARAALAGLRFINLTSEPILPADIAAFRPLLSEGCEIQIGYAMTEAGQVARWLVPRGAEEGVVRLPVGYPNRRYDFAVLGEDGAPVRRGEAGVLWLRGDLVSIGEWRGGRLVPGRGVEDPARPGVRVLETGDVMCWRADGLLELLGRADDMVKVAGNLVAPGQVEEALRRHPGVADAAVVARRDGGSARLEAHVVPADGAVLETEAVYRGLRAVLPGYMVPGRIVVVDAIARLPSGKVDRAGLLGREA